jgi:hypothetical protein
MINRVKTAQLFPATPVIHLSIKIEYGKVNLLSKYRYILKDDSSGFFIFFFCRTAVSGDNADIFAKVTFISHICELKSHALVKY